MRIAGNAIGGFAVGVRVGIVVEFVLDALSGVSLSSCAVFCDGFVLRSPGALVSSQQMPGATCHIPIDLRGIHGFDNERRGGREFGRTLVLMGLVGFLLQEFVLGINFNGWIGWRYLCLCLCRACSIVIDLGFLQRQWIIVVIEAH